MYDININIYTGYVIIIIFLLNKITVYNGPIAVNDLYNARG